VTPPFKPVVESDESTSNFDPEFTSADIREVALTEMDLDEEDPSENWVSQSIGGAGLVYTPNGPLGSEKDSKHAPGSTGVSSPVGRLQGIQIKQKKKHKETVGSPLTNSVQANFRGFTYSGGESIVALGSLAHFADTDEAAVDDDEFVEPTTEDEYDEVGKSVGRYANARRKGQLTGLDDDMS